MDSAPTPWTPGHWATGSAMRMLATMRKGVYTAWSDAGLQRTLAQARAHAHPCDPDAPLTTHTYPEGIVLVYADTSALALQRTACGHWCAPAWVHTAPAWTPSQERSLLTTHWDPLAPIDNTNPERPLTRIECCEPRNPQVLTTKAVWDRRTALVEGARRLLLDTVDPHDVDWTERMDMDIIRDTPYSLPRPRSFVASPHNHQAPYMRQTRLMHAIHHLFPNRLGWAADWVYPLSFDKLASLGSKPGQTPLAPVSSSPQRVVELEADAFLTLPLMGTHHLSAHERMLLLSAIGTISQKALYAITAPFEHLGNHQTS